MSLATAVANDARTRRNRAAPAGRVKPAAGDAERPEAKPPAVSLPTLIVGLDDRGRPHASRFAVADADVVERAAAMMGMTTLSVESAGLAELAAKLPAGRLFASGKAFVPFVGQELYRRLEAYLPIAQRIDPALTPADMAKSKTRGAAAQSDAGQAGGDGGGAGGDAGDAAIEQNKYAAAKATKTPRSGKYPEDWDKIVAGHIVLASAERDDGWWTAHVREVREDGTYLLEWEEWKGFAKFVCRREQIALLHPDYDGK